MPEILQSSSIKAKIILGFSVVLTIILFLGFIGISSMKRSVKITNKIAEMRLPAINYLIQADCDLNQSLT